jgi:hypothetical protein
MIVNVAGIPSPVKEVIPFEFCKNCESAKKFNERERELL